MSDNADFIIKDDTLTKYLGNEEIVVVPNGVKNINIDAFKGRDYKYNVLRGIILPPSLEKLADSVFAELENLEVISFPSSLQTIPKYCCKDCINLRTVNISEGVVEIDEEAFVGCLNVSNLLLPKSLIRMRNDRFFEGPKSITVQTESMMDYLEETDGGWIDTFNNIALGTDPSLFYPSRMQDISLNLLEFISNKDSGMIPSVRDKWKNVFFRNFHFYKYSERYSEEVLDYIYENRKLLSLLDLKLILYYRDYCQNEEWIEKIEKYTTEVFNKTRNTKTLEKRFEKYISIVNDYFFYIREDNTVVLIDGYNKSQPYIEIPDKIRGAKVTEIGPYLFRPKKEIIYSYLQAKTIKLGKYVTKISDYGFYKSHTLEKIILPENLEYLGDQCFRECAITSIEIPKNIKHIGSYCFEGCKQLKTIKLPDNLEELPEGFFCNCTGINKIVLPEVLKIIGPACFRLCMNLKELTLPTSVEYIGDAAFDNCQSIEKMVIPEGVTKITSQLFRCCENLEEVVLPTTIRSLGYSVFASCSKLTKIEIPHNVESLGSLCFVGCISLEHLYIPPSVKYFGRCIFRTIESISYEKKSRADEYLNNETFIWDEIKMLFKNLYGKEKVIDGLL